MTPTGFILLEGERKNVRTGFACRMSIRLKRNKYLYLYDFGDEWIFYITVMKIWEADQKISAKVVQSQEHYANIQIVKMFGMKMGMFGMMKTIGMPKTTVMNTVVNSRTIWSLLW